MTTIRHCDQFVPLYASLKAKGQPLTIEGLVKVWARENYDELVRVALAAMRKQAGTHFTVAPLTFVGFESEEARQKYNGVLIEEVQRIYRAVTAKRIACLHVERFVIWVRREVENQLAGLAKEATYQREVTTKE